jgi:hypothetical protein
MVAYSNRAEMGRRQIRQRSVARFAHRLVYRKTRTGFVRCKNDEPTPGPGTCRDYSTVAGVNYGG